MTVKQYEEEDIRDALKMEKWIHKKGYRNLLSYEEYKQDRLDRELKRGKAPMLEAREKAAEKIYRGVL